MKLTVVKTYRVNISTEVEVPDEDLAAGLDFSDLVEKAEDELELGEGFTAGDVSGTSISVLDEDGNELYADEDY